MKNEVNKNENNSASTGFRSIFKNLKNQKKFLHTVGLYNKNSKVPTKIIGLPFNNCKNEQITSYNIKDENEITNINENSMSNSLPMLNSFSGKAKKLRAQSALDKYKSKLKCIENMFNTNPKIFINSPENKKNKVTFGLVPGIPEDFLSRIKYVFNLFKNPLLINYIKKAPNKEKSTLLEIIDYLMDYKTTSPYNDLENFALIFYYICKNIKYDTKNINKDENNLENILKSGFANSLQFNKIFEYICRRKLLKVKTIKGFCKLKEIPYFKLGTDCTKINHYWNAIYINSKWYFCDLTFGSGGIKKISDEENENNKFNPFFFLTSPDSLIETHLPKEDLWQMTTKIIPPNQFCIKKETHTSEFYQKIFEYSINLITHEYPIIRSISKTIIIKIGVKNIIIQPILYHSDHKNKISDVKYNSNEEENIFTIEVVCPSNGEYWLDILCRKINNTIDTNDNYFPLISYKIFVDQKHIEENKKKKFLSEKQIIKRPKSVRLPFMGSAMDNKDLNKNNKSQKICMDNEGAKLLSPLEDNIKLGKENDFKLRVPNSENVCILDGHRWNYLKRMKKDKNLWYGKVMIYTENITVLSMKSNSLFTEVFQFKAKGNNILSYFNKTRKEGIGKFRSMK